MNEGVAAPRLPDLPKLNAADVEAIRASFPGKLLGRTAALLSVVTLVLGFAASSDLALEKGLHIDLGPWRSLVLFGLPAGAVATQLFREWRARRSKALARDLANQPTTAQQEYFRIGPYRDVLEDVNAFARADRAHEKTLNWLLDANAVPLYLTGDSGTGKTSLISAFLLPNLRKKGWEVVNARAWESPSVAIANMALAVEKRWQTKSDPSLPNALVIVDQFEELLISRHREQEEALKQSIRFLIEHPVPGLRVLLVLRSEYIFVLDELELPRLRQDHNWQSVNSFRTRAALAFLKGGSPGFEDDTLARIVASASELDGTPGLVRPITLNVLGHLLEGSTSALSLDAGVLVRSYIRQSVNQPGTRDFSRLVLKQLITEQGARQPRSEHELAQSTNLRRGEIRAVLNNMSVAGLARTLDAREAVWELSHDFVARAVSSYLGQHTNAMLRTALFYTAPALTALAVILGLFWDSRDPFLLIPPSASPIAYLDGKITSGRVARFTVKLMKGATIVSDPDPRYSEQVFYFPGPNSYAEFNIQGLPIGNADRSLLLWVYPTETATLGNESFFAGYGGFSGFRSTYDLYASWDGTVAVSNWGAGIPSSERIVINQWQCVASVASHVADPSVNTVYVGGTSQVSKMDLATIPTSRFFIGGMDAKLISPDQLPVRRALSGFIKHVMIFDRALSRRDVTFICKHPNWKP